jgi:hypothetical protein
MTIPKDHNSSVTKGRVHTARIFSNIVSPPAVFAVLGLALSLAALPLLQAFIWAAIYGFFVSLMPILIVIYFLHTNRIGDLHMNLPQERRIPYLVSVTGAIIYLVLVLIFEAPELLWCLALLSLIALGSLGFINLFWKISIHAASILSATLIAGLVFGPFIALLLSPLVIIVTWVRLYLRRHTVPQVAAGLALGLVIVLALTLIGCFA